MLRSTFSNQLQDSTEIMKASMQVQVCELSRNTYGAVEKGVRQTHRSISRWWHLWKIKKKKRVWERNSAERKGEKIDAIVNRQNVACANDTKETESKFHISHYAYNIFLYKKFSVKHLIKYCLVTWVTPGYSLVITGKPTNYLIIKIKP